jgi:hypothetical protein
MAAAVRTTVGGLVRLGPSMANAARLLVSAAQHRRIAVLDVWLGMVSVIDLEFTSKPVKEILYNHFSSTCA